MIKGFTYGGKCNCGGTPNERWAKDGYIVYYLKKRRSFHVKHINNYILKNQPIANLCKELKSLGLVISEDCLGES